MRCARLILETGPVHVSIRFHPRLTVVAGLGRAERERFTSELVGALVGGRGGAHLEVVDGRGRHLAVLRPPGGDDRVIELSTRTDVTAALRGDQGVDLLACVGVPRHDARRRLRVRAEDLQVEQHGDDVVAQLAGRPQQRLWRAARNVSDAEAWVAAEATGAGRRRHEAADAHRAALLEWRRLAGDVDVDVAIRLKARVSAAVGGVADDGERRLVADGGFPAPTGTAALARALTARMARQARAGAGHEPLPLVLDEPFAGLPDRVVRELLELVLATEGVQLVLLTGDPLVTEWGERRVAAGCGLTLVRPGADTAAPDREGVTAVLGTER